MLRFAATVFIVTRRTINVPTSIDVDQLVAELVVEIWKTSIDYGVHNITSVQFPSGIH